MHLPSLTGLRIQPCPYPLAAFLQGNEVVYKMTVTHTRWSENESNDIVVRNPVWDVARSMHDNTADAAPNYGAIGMSVKIISNGEFNELEEGVAGNKDVTILYTEDAQDLKVALLAGIGDMTNKFPNVDKHSSEITDYENEHSFVFHTAPGMWVDTVRQADYGETLMKGISDLQAWAEIFLEEEEKVPVAAFPPKFYHVTIKRVRWLEEDDDRYDPVLDAHDEELDQYREIEKNKADTGSYVNPTYGVVDMEVEVISFLKYNEYKASVENESFAEKYTVIKAEDAITKLSEFTKAIETKVSYPHGEKSFKRKFETPEKPDQRVNIMHTFVVSASGVNEDAVCRIVLPDFGERLEDGHKQLIVWVASFLGGEDLYDHSPPGMQSTQGGFEYESESE